MDPEPRNGTLPRSPTHDEKAKITSLMRDWRDQAWRLRTAWVSTKIYQGIRDLLSDYVFDLVMPPSTSAKKMSSRRNFNPDYKLQMYEKVKRPILDKSPREFDGVSPFSYSAMNFSDDRFATRFLMLHPGDDESHIQITLEVGSLQSCSPYDALSYTWGDKIYHAIECNGKMLRIQENAWLALHALRRPNEVRKLWVDAICINQDDTDERSRQVLLMRQIFQQATIVIVWLGPESSGTKNVFDLLGTLSKARASEELEKQSQPFTTQDLLTARLPGRTEQAWTDLDMFYWQTWFTRVWIIQEMAVAQTIIFRCGRHLCTYDDLEAASNYIVSHSLTALTGVDPSKFIRLSQFRQDYQQRNPDSACIDLILCRARQSYSTDARDKVFGVLGLIRQSRTPLPLTPTYTQSYGRVYIDTARLIIENSKSLDVLSATDDHRSSLIDELPSWVPDWEVSHPRFSPFCTAKAFAHWQASGNLEPSLEFSTDGLRLGAVGFLVDAVNHVSDSFLEFSPVPGGDISAHNVTKIVNWSSKLKSIANNTVDFYAQQRWRQWERIAMNLGIYPNESAVMDVFARTITADYDFGSTSSLEMYKSWKRIWEYATTYEGNKIEKAYDGMTSAELANAMKFLEAHRKASFGRRLFTTTRGFMGIGPNRLRRGMLIWVLGGGRTPYVLRKRKNQSYTFLGECYIHGAMEGQLVPRNETARKIWID
ncbi:uncharacterized protein PV09_01128 [Verruconis gallopava]|uniref:Heterokaryon incompatibility domain-containing protein n=1 Tax=Verruconis gallopava TaxID=253628 RepID=A0A0D2AN91_9PEZI|nr:uncharacterized protein PV09_01128 [Verruconis gallopava]KIW08198.1 hypothetical protein PV09_01128 [Verruconis gallopava]